MPWKFTGLFGMSDWAYQGLWLFEFVLVSSSRIKTYAVICKGEQCKSSSSVTERTFSSRVLRDFNRQRENGQRAKEQSTNNLQTQNQRLVISSYPTHTVNAIQNVIRSSDTPLTVIQNSIRLQARSLKFLLPNK